MLEPRHAVGRPSGSTPWCSRAAPRHRTDTVATVYAGNGAAADYQRVDAQGKIAVVERSDAVAPRGARRGRGRGRCEGADRRQRRHRRAERVRRRVAHPGRDACTATPAPTSSRWPRRAAKLTAQADDVHRLRLRPDPRATRATVPDQPLVYHPTKSDLAKIDARYYAVQQRPGSRGTGTTSPSARRSAATSSSGTRAPGSSGSRPARCGSSRTPRTSTARCPGRWSRGSTPTTAGKTDAAGLVPTRRRPGFSDSFGVYNSRWQNYMTWNVQDWSSFSDNMRLGGYLPWGETPTMLHVYQGKHLIHTNKFSSDMNRHSVCVRVDSRNTSAGRGRPAPPGRAGCPAGTPATACRSCTCSSSISVVALVDLQVGRRLAPRQEAAQAA